MTATILESRVGCACTATFFHASVPEPTTFTADALERSGPCARRERCGERKNESGRRGHHRPPFDRRCPGHIAHLLLGLTVSPFRGTGHSSFE